MPTNSYVSFVQKRKQTADLKKCKQTADLGHVPYFSCHDRHSDLCPRLHYLSRNSASRHVAHVQLAFEY